MEGLGSSTIEVKTSTWLEGLSTAAVQLQRMSARRSIIKKKLPYLSKSRLHLSRSVLAIRACSRFKVRSMYSPISSSKES